jgi:predicted ABC-type ATPase
VFSHPSKVEELRVAKNAGFKTYLYVVATETPTINIGRVASRVELGGHGVPDAKIIERYEKSMANMAQALTIVDKAFFFDNSESRTGSLTFPLIAEKKEGSLMVCDTNLPQWFVQWFIPKG